MAIIDKKIWVISAHPKQGDRSGPHSSSVGKEFVSFLLNQGIKFKDIHFDYLVNKVPPPRKLTAGIQYFKEAGIFESEISRLRAVIQENKPNIILCLGADVLRDLMGFNDVNKWRGHVVWNDELNCKMIATYEPFHAYGQKRVRKEQKPGQYWTLLEADVRKCVAESHSRELSHAEPELIVAPSYMTARAELERMIAEAKIISYDIEVLKPYEGRLMDCIGLCDSTERAICIPFYIPNEQNAVVRYFKHEAEHLHIMLLIKKLMESNIPKIAQNSQFDTTMLEKYYGIKTHNLVWDTMVAMHDLYCDLPKDLGTLISLFTNLPYHKYMIHEAGSASRWTYNAADAVANLHVMQGQMADFYEYEGRPVPEFPQNGEIPHDFFTLEAARHYYKVPNATIPTCVHMHIAGVKVDMELRSRVIALETGVKCQLEEALNYAITQPMHKNKKSKINFNPLSSQQKSMLFYGCLGCKEQRNNGKATTDKHALKKFSNDKRHYVATLAKACLEAKAADARLLKFKVEPDSGYIRTQYDVTGTDTGRLASKESDVMPAGTNLQNIAPGPQRQMFIPEEGEEFALVDLYAAEAYLNALDAGEMDMLRMISGMDDPNTSNIYLNGMPIRVMSEDDAKKYKIHNWMQNVTRQNFEDECDAADYTYKKAKQTIHALNYNVMPDKMRLESGLPDHVCQWQYAMYHHKFPGIKMRMQRINQQIRRNRYLISPMGRRRFFIQDISSELFNIAYAWPSQSCIGEITEVAQNFLHHVSDLHALGRDVPFCRPVLNTHDGLAIRIKKDTRDKVIEQIVRAFHIPLTINGITIVIPVSIAFGPNFNDKGKEFVYFYPLDI